MEILRYILGSLFVLFGLYGITLSYIRQITNYRHIRQGIDSWSSPTPFLGPLAILIGSLVLPLQFGWWILFVFLVDPDTIIALISLPPLIRDIIRENSNRDNK